MNKTAIVIGVDRVASGLPPLTAAASGACDVAHWLTRNDYKVELVTDGHGPVTRLDIFDRVNALVNAGNVERLLIYFAGHGFLNGPLDEYWLLSGAPVDAAEAVNVTASVNMARFRGFREVMIISDACRLQPTSAVHGGISGASIFPNLVNSGSPAEIDLYYATRPGDPSLERKAQEANGAHGLFTAALLGAHKDAEPEAIVHIDGRDFVRARWLKKVLRERVDERAQAISLALTQQPDIRLETENSYIAEKEDDGTAPAPAAAPPFRRTQVPVPPPSTSFELSRSFPGRGRKAMPRTASRKSAPSPPRSPAPAASGATPLAPSLISADARANGSFSARFETILKAQTVSEGAEDWKQGMETLRCHGEPITGVATTIDWTRMVATPSDRGSLLAVPLGNDSHGQIAIRFTDGSGMFLPVLRDYRCDVVRERGRTISLSYSWLGERNARLGQLRAEVLSAATLGFLTLKPDAIAVFADRIRQRKKYDPVLGLVAVLAYTIIGDTVQARSVRDYMRDDNQAELFDTWLLGGGAADAGTARSARPIVPPVPLLSQTWSYLDAFGSPIGEDLKSLSRVPGFWTVFDDAAMRTVMEMAGEPKREALLYGED